MHLECLATLFDPKNSTNFVSIHTLSAREFCECSFCFLRWEKGKREEIKYKQRVIRGSYTSYLFNFCVSK